MSCTGEFDFNSYSGASMSGGVLNVTKLLTSQNGSNPTGAIGSTFNFSGGTINDNCTAFGGWYNPEPLRPFNFTLGSTGVINFIGVNAPSIAQVDNWIAGTGGSNPGFAINGVVDTNLSDYSVTSIGNTTTLELAAVPEPSVFASIAAGATALLMFRRRRA